MQRFYKVTLANSRAINSHVSDGGTSCTYISYIHSVELSQIGVAHATLAKMSSNYYVSTW